VRLNKALSLSILLATFLFTSSVTRADQAGSDAKVDEDVEGGVKIKQLPWHDSTFGWSNSLSALTFSTTDNTYNPYFDMMLAFRPRYYIRDDFSLRARLLLDVELTVADDTSSVREWVVSDLWLDAVYDPKWMEIPFLKVQVIPSVRFVFPTSIVSRARSLVMGIGPGFTLRREIPLLKKKVLNSLELTYGFRAIKNFNQYAETSIDISLCANFNRPECQQDGGKRNVATEMVNFFDAKLQILEKLSFSLTMFVINDFVYGLKDTTVQLEGYTSSTNQPIMPANAGVNMRGYLWGIIDLSYDFYDWLGVSAQVSTFHPMITPSANEYYGPWFNRYTQLSLGVTITTDKLYNQVKKWAHSGQPTSNDPTLQAAR
jgi:hypothetical protein